VNPESPTQLWGDLLRRVIGLTAEDLRGSELFGRIAELVARAAAADVCFLHVVNELEGDLVLAGATPGFEHLVGTSRASRPSSPTSGTTPATTTSRHCGARTSAR
jgi:hypothetical protein